MYTKLLSYTYMNIYIRTYILSYIRTYIHKFIRRTHTCIHINTRMYIGICISVYVYIEIHVRMNMYVFGLWCIVRWELQMYLNKPIPVTRFIIHYDNHFFGIRSTLFIDPPDSITRLEWLMFYVIAKSCFSTSIFFFQFHERFFTVSTEILFDYVLFLWAYNQMFDWFYVLYIYVCHSLSLSHSPSHRLSDCSCGCAYCVCVACECIYV